MLDFSDYTTELDSFDVCNSFFNPLDDYQQDIYEPTYDIDSELQTQTKEDDPMLSQKQICSRENQQRDKQNRRDTLQNRQNQPTTCKAQSVQQEINALAISDYSDMPQENGNQNEVKTEQMARKRRKINEFKVADSDQVTKMRQELQNIIHSKKYSDEYKKKCSAKLRNRISAQQSRDRQKALLQQLEIQNIMLLKENEQLKNQVHKLQKQNQDLRASIASQQQPGVNSKGLLNSALLTALTVICCLAFISTTENINFTNQRHLTTQIQQEQLQNYSSFISSKTSNKFLFQDSSQIQNSSDNKFLRELETETIYDKKQDQMTMYCESPQVFYQKDTYFQLQALKLIIPNKVFSPTMEGVIEMELKILNIDYYFDHDESKYKKQHLLSKQ